MCGIAGLLQPMPHDPTMRAAVARMVDHLRHRGPDGSAVEMVSGIVSPTVVLGHTRLAIIDISTAGNQPMVDSERGTWITFNGEIYNYRALRNELTVGDRPWRSTSDTEVVLRAYARWGRACLERLRGMFAFGIWDPERRELFLARDRLGIKPLYYATASDGAFVFASEVRAILASGLVPKELDPVGVSQYLTYQAVPAPRTLVNGISALVPAASLVVDEVGHAKQHVYWDILSRERDAPRSEAESRAGVAHLLRESVALHLVSDVPVGAFLSGGIDSTAVVALMREAGVVPRTFSVGFAERAFDESSYAELVARRFGTHHSQILLRERDLLDQLPDALAAMDQPTGDGVNTYVLARAVRDTGIKVALSGLGGDELFAGYPSFARLADSARLFRVWGHAPAPIRAIASRGVRALAGSSVAATKAAQMVASDGKLASLYPVTRQVLSATQRRALLADGLAHVSARDPYVDLLRDVGPGVGALTAISFAEARTYMHDVLLRDTDQMSMARALEVRVPLLDHQLVELVMSLPDGYKRPGQTPKRLLVDAMGGLLPDEIVHRPKQGFVLPFDAWLRGPMRQFCEARLRPDRLEQRGVFTSAAASALWQAFLDRRPDITWSRPWLLVVLEEWLDLNGF